MNDLSAVALVVIVAIGAAIVGGCLAALLVAVTIASGRANREEDKKCE